MAISQKKFLTGLAFTGLFLILLAIAPELSGSGKKEFGSMQMFVLRNGLVIFISGLISLVFPGIINFIKNIFDDTTYRAERTNPPADRTSFSKYEFMALLVFLIAANLFAIYCVGKEKTIYTWDSAHFWSRYVLISDMFKANPLKALNLTIDSTQLHEYNYFASFLLIPFSLLFGTERLPYILSIVNIFLFPSAIAFLFLYKRTAGMLNGSRAPLSAIIASLFTFFAFPFIWTPLFNGYSGLGGFFIMILVLFAYFKYPFPAQRYRTLIIMGILISTLVLLRRWYGFWAVSFFISLVITELIFLFAEYRFDLERLLALSKKIFVTIFSSGVFFLMFAAPLFILFITYDYSHYVNIYNFSDTTLQHFKRFLRHFGLFYVILSVLGASVSLYYRNTRKFAFFLLLQWGIMFFQFTKLHSFLPQHYYLLQPTMILFISLLMTAVLLNIRSKLIKVATCSVYILISSFFFYTVFSPEASIYTKQARTLFPAQRYYPRVRNDIPEIKRMLNVLEVLLADPNDRLYVLASSSTLNSDILKKAHLSLRNAKDMQKQIFTSSDLDMKDGFPNNLFLARYILVTDPIQHDFDSKKCQVVIIPAESILSGKNMGASYRRLHYKFRIDKGVKIYIYERTGPFNQSDVNFLSEALRKKYPDHPKIYLPAFQ